MINAKSRENQRIFDINMYDNFPLNRGTFIESKPLVKRGDRVIRGQLLADTNHTLGGNLALGVNLTTAVMPYKGETHEDGSVISVYMPGQRISRFDRSYSITTNNAASI